MSESDDKAAKEKFKFEYKRKSFSAFFQQLEVAPEPKCAPSWDYSFVLVCMEKKRIGENKATKLIWHLYTVFMTESFKFMGLYRLTENQKIQRVRKIPDELKKFVSEMEAL